MKKFAATIVLIIMLAGAILFNLNARKTEQPQNNASTKPSDFAIPVVTVATAHSQTTRESLTLVGTIKADLRSSISAKSAAKILAILVKEGDTVSVGQPLVKLDNAFNATQLEGATAGQQGANAQYLKAVDGKRARILEMDARIAEAKSGVTTAEGRVTQAKLAVKLNEEAVKIDLDKVRSGIKQTDSVLDQARIGADAARKTLKRVQYLFDHGGAPKVDFDGAKTQVDIADSQLQQAIAAAESAKSAMPPAESTGKLRIQVSGADLSTAEAGLYQAKEGLSNATRARAEAINIADRDILAAKAALNQARANTNGLQSVMGDAVITSPIAGTIVDLTAHTGDIAQPGQPILAVVSPGSTYLEAACPVRFSTTIHPGLVAAITVQSSPDSTLQGEVISILPVSSLDGRSFPVRIKVSENQRLSPGVIAKAVVDLDRDKNAVTIPFDAVRNEGTQDYSLVVVNGEAKRRDIVLGGTDGANARVIKGLAVGEKVIVSGPAILNSGTKVSVVER